MIYFAAYSNNRKDLGETDKWIMYFINPVAGGTREDCLLNV